MASTCGRRAVLAPRPIQREAAMRRPPHRTSRGEFCDRAAIHHTYLPRLVLPGCREDVPHRSSAMGRRAGSSASLGCRPAVRNRVFVSSAGGRSSLVGFPAGGGRTVLNHEPAPCSARADGGGFSRGARRRRPATPRAVERPSAQPSTDVPRQVVGGLDEGSAAAPAVDPSAPGCLLCGPSSGLVAELGAVRSPRSRAPGLRLASTRLLARRPGGRLALLGRPAMPWDASRSWCGPPTVAAPPHRRRWDGVAVAQPRYAADGSSSSYATRAAGSPLFSTPAPTARRWWRRPRQDRPVGPGRRTWCCRPTAPTCVSHQRRRLSGSSRPVSDPSRRARWAWPLHTPSRGRVAPLRVRRWPGPPRRWAYELAEQPPKPARTTLALGPVSVWVRARPPLPRCAGGARTAPGGGPPAAAAGVDYRPCCAGPRRPHRPVAGHLHARHAHS